MEYQFKLGKKYQFTTLQEEQFTLFNLQSQLKQSVKAGNFYKILHFATHGDFDSDPNNPFLVTGKGAITMNDLRDLIGITSLKSPIELLTLSACQTALGNDRAALGLAGIALKAGARSAVASLWLVNDPATAQLEHSHPYYWAAFLFIGNWL